MTNEAASGSQSFWNAIGTYGSVVRGALSRWAEDNGAGVSDPRRWLLCSAAASAIVGSSADAEMIYSGILNVSSTSGVTIDVYGHPIAFEHRIVYENSGSRIRDQFKGRAPRADKFHGPHRIHVAEVVGAFKRGEILFADDGSYYASYLAGQSRSVQNGLTRGTWVTGAFKFGQTLFAGLELQERDGSHTAWVRLRIDDLDGNRSPDRVTIFDWAYETRPGFNVGAGSLTTIPEPGTLALASLALGCAGLDRLRRRRKVAAPVQPSETGH